MRNFVLKACALARVLIKPVTWLRLSKLLENRQDCHQAPRSDRASLRHMSFASLGHSRYLRLNTWHGKTLKQVYYSSFSDVFSDFCAVFVDFP